MDSYYLKGQTYIAQEDTVLIFIDETGDENTFDSKYPIFGFGGCCIQTKLYNKNIVEPWQFLKTAYFNKLNKPMHATDLRNPTNEQLNVLNDFFSSYEFGRFATVITDKTIFEVPNNVFQIAAASVYMRIADILKNITFSSISMIFEESDRTRNLVEKVFSNYDIQDEVNGIKKNIPIDRYFMKKSSLEPGLEVADFIIHSAGTTVRDRLSGKISSPIQRKDSFCIFNSINKNLVSYIEIKNIRKT